jgi:hypothetical protein
MICLFVISFKVAAGSIFIQSAIERAQLLSHACINVMDLKSASDNDAQGDQQPVHTMNLMSHVTANVTDVQIFIPAPAESSIAYGPHSGILYFDNIPDSAFKPPKNTA